MKNKELIITIFTLAFLVSFRMWGGLVFDPIVGITNFVFGALIIWIGLSLKLHFQKKYSNRLGYEFKYEFSPFGLLAGIILAIPTFGWFLLLQPGTFDLTLKKRHKIGRVYKGVLFLDMLKISLVGSLALLVLAIGLKIIYSLTLEPLFQYGLFVSLALLVYSLLPLPKNDGIHIFFQSRVAFLAIFLFFSAFSVSFYFLNLIKSLLLAIIFSTGLYFQLSKSLK
jgi:hypothetical protein